MTNKTIENQLFTIVKVYLPQDVDANTITPESHLMKELGINSAHLVDIALDVEDAFDIMLDENDMQAMETVSDAVQIVATKIKK